MMMGMRDAPVDAGERELATVQLDDMALAHVGKPWIAWKNAVLEWHLQQIAQARAEAWIPGLAGVRDPAVDQALSRYYGQDARAVVASLRAENNELRRKFLDAIACVRFYASGGIDTGARAHAVLTKLLSEETAAPVTSTAARTVAAKRGH
jgi:hypothetical protein